MSGRRIAIVMHCIVFLCSFGKRRKHDFICFVDSTGDIDCNYIARLILFSFHV